MKIGPMEAQLFQADARTDMKLIEAFFCNFVKAHKNCACNLPGLPRMKNVIMVHIMMHSRL